ncbi:MAG: hypothetical protein ACKVPX_14210 [Myxococcaceae bacterium]
MFAGIGRGEPDITIAHERGMLLHDVWEVVRRIRYDLQLADRHQLAISALGAGLARLGQPTAEQEERLARVTGKARQALERLSEGLSRSDVAKHLDLDRRSFIQLTTLLLDTLQVGTLSQAVRQFLSAG